MDILKKTINLTKKIGLARVIPGAINFLCLFVTINILGPEQYGAFSIALGFISLSIMLTYGWIIHGLVPALSGKSSLEKLYFLPLKISLTISFFFFILIIPLYFISNNYSVYLFLFLFYGLDLIFLELLRASQKLNLYSVASIMRSIVILTGLYTISILSISSDIVCLFIYGLGSFFSILIIVKFDENVDIIGLHKTRVNKDVFKLILNSGLKSNFISLIDNFVPTILKTIVLYDLGAQASSQFSAAVDISKRLIGIIFNITSFVGMPSIYLNFDNNDNKAFFKELKFLFYYSMSGVILLLIVLLIAESFGFPISGFNFQSDNLVFIAVSIGIVVQRSRKILADPYIIIKLPILKLITVTTFVLIILFLSYIFIGMTSVEIIAIYFIAYSALLSICYFLIVNNLRKLS